MTYSQALAQKENHLAELKRLEVMQRRGELLPVAYVRQWASRYLTGSVVTGGRFLLT